jgi:chloride channel 3/4/5
VKFNLQIAAFRRKFLAKHGVAEAVVLATVTAMIGYSNQFLRIDMTESMSILFRECDNGGNVNNVCQCVAYFIIPHLLRPRARFVRLFPHRIASHSNLSRSSLQWRISNSLLLATVIRIGLVVVSYGCKVPAGIFVPSMAIGATFGRMIGIMVKAMYTLVFLPSLLYQMMLRKPDVRQSLSRIRDIRGLRPGRTVHHPGDVCFSRRRSGPQVRPAQRGRDVN